MSQGTMEITNLESLLGDLEEQQKLFTEPMESPEGASMAIVTTPGCITLTIISIKKKC